MIHLQLIAEIDAETPAEAQDKLDAFREAVLPTENYGITLYQSDDFGTLWQFECEKNGTLFYYQTGPGWIGPPDAHIVERCPVCGSKRIKLTGCKFPGVKET